LDDINLHSLDKGVNYSFESKKMCFLVPNIKSVKYTVGAHCAKFTGDIKYSTKIYINKHMEFLGLNYYLNKKKNRNIRAKIAKCTTNSLNNFLLRYVWLRYSPFMSIHKINYLNTCKKSKKIYENNDQKIIKAFIDLFIQLIL
jgi:hypothetical protein